MDVERTIEFLLEQQSKHDARLAKVEELLVELATSHERTNEIVAVLTKRQVQTEEMLQSLIQIVERQIASHS
jgi:Tfp pilus assembly protein PilN